MEENMTPEEKRKLAIKEYIHEITSLGFLMILWLMLAITPIYLYTLDSDFAKGISNSEFIMLYMIHLLVLEIFLMNLFNLNQMEIEDYECELYDQRRDRV